MLSIESKYRNPAIYGLSILFIIINSFIIYYFGFLYFSFFPIVFLIIVIGIISYDKLFFIIAFFTPLSLSLTYFFPNISFNFSILTEPLLVFLLFILIYKFLIHRKINTAIVTHPISLAIIFNLSWMLITTFTSTMPLISAKYFLSRLWFVVPMYFFGIIIFRDTKNIKTFLWAYAITLFIVFIYSTVRLSEHAFFTKHAAHFAVKPFYNDHTAYGAILALFTPIFWGLSFRANVRAYKKIIAFIFACAFTVGVALSYSRAAWIGLIVAVIILFFVKLRIKFKYILAVALIIGLTIFAFWFQILNHLEKNRQDSSSNITEQIGSMTNVSTDASNLERLNRWHCAIEMFKEKPITGWGPGTYQFQYAPFQLERMKTIISTDFGDVGNAHSEYLGPLAEEGFLGFISVLWIVLAILISGLRIYKNTSDKELKMIAIGVTLGFVTYFVHGMLNDFLDSDKLAVPFFAFAAILTAIDLNNKENKNKI